MPATKSPKADAEGGEPHFTSRFGEEPVEDWQASHPEEKAPEPDFVDLVLRDAAYEDGTTQPMGDDLQAYLEADESEALAWGMGAAPGVIFET